MEIIHDEPRLWLAHGVIGRVIDAVNDRDGAGEPEPDVDNLEDEGNPNNNSAGFSPPSSPIQQVIQTPTRQSIVGLDTLSPAWMVPQGYMRPKLAPGSVPLPLPIQYDV